jgi:hypothetical protein
MIRRSGQTQLANGRPGLLCRCGACCSAKPVQSMTWLGCQDRHPADRAATRGGPADARQRHRVVGRASPESHWNIGNTGLSHQACQRIPCHSDVVERQQHTVDGQSKSGRLFPSCPVVLPCKAMDGLPLTLHGRSTAAGHPLGWRPDSPCVWCPSARTSLAAASATSKVQMSLRIAAGSI